MQLPDYTASHTVPLLVRPFKLSV